MTNDAPIGKWSITLTTNNDDHRLVVSEFVPSAASPSTMGILIAALVSTTFVDAGTLESGGGVE
jgi:hypothetical protein